MGAVGFLALACGGLMIYAGFTGQPLVSTVQGIFSGTPSKAGGAASKPGGAAEKTTSRFSGGGGTF